MDILTGLKTFKHSIYTSILISCICAPSFTNAMEALSDDQLSKVDGQALLNLTYTQGTDLSGSGGINQSNLGFYRLGLEAQIALNANINKLQLGCGGIKGAGCDIDIDNAALTGITTSTAQGAGVTSDFLLNNPFIEFAIANPTSSSTRNVVGLRLGALSALGMLSLGSNTNTNTLSDDTGLNTISGQIGVKVTNATINNVNATLFGLPLLTGSANIANYSTSLVVNRASSFSLTGMTAVASGSLLGLTLTNVNMNNIPFTTVHRLQVSDANGNPTSNLSLSLQSQDVDWQNVSDGSWNTTAAQRGWWMTIPQTQFANLSTTQTVNLGVVTALTGALGVPVNLNAIDLGQTPVNNCYGKLKFC